MSMPQRRLYRCRACQVEVFIKATRRPLEARCPECKASDFESVEMAGAHPRATVDELLAKALEREGRDAREASRHVEEPACRDI
ncbi:zinc ribbon domain-containing protein [Chromohalobacter japonicus]|uniref:zinc ribbon domain-containing protein n=1 Tax=Chromohalobacter japonicus TaxID=223900 RepID=UPI00058F7856|nr:zinc ribbon domain-containing protein [Chromohalobacter japonicus]